MPLTLGLAVPGNLSRVLNPAHLHSSRILSRAAEFPALAGIKGYSGYRSPCRHLHSLPLGFRSRRAGSPSHPVSTLHRTLRLEHPLSHLQCHTYYSVSETAPDSRTPIHDISVQTSIERRAGEDLGLYHWREHKAKSRNARKSRRKSRPSLVLDSISPDAQDLYARSVDPRLDASYQNPQRRRFRHVQAKHILDHPGEKWETIFQEDKIALHKQENVTIYEKERTAMPEQEAVSLYSVLARYLKITSTQSQATAETGLSRLELNFLASKGFSEQDLDQWAASITERKSRSASEILLGSNSQPPMFVLLIFLRRKNIGAVALGSLMRYLAWRLQDEHISWGCLKTLTIRLVRHARRVWPESMPWIATVFTAEATRMYEHATRPGRHGDNFTRELGHFCNTLISQFSLPTNLHPIMFSRFQETAQFEVLGFMARCSPTIAVNRTGFKGAIRIQLAHEKTPNEREWASMKSMSWPPWKQDRTAMDEEKGYEFGASRASNILHRMYEAGYSPDLWERLAQLYAGWDTDLSPTIQTRTILPHSRKALESRQTLSSLLWAARIRTTRTRREAWACFLAFETSKSAVSLDIYQAMFEKLYYPEHVEFDSSALPDHSQNVLPGDMMEVLPEPHSPLQLVEIAEPVPTFAQLYYRMREKDIEPAGRTLAFLLQSSLDFPVVIELLESSKSEFDGHLGKLVDGSVLREESAVPPYMLGAFIRFLCRFGVRSRIPNLHPTHPSADDHAMKFTMDRQYLLDYAYSLLIHTRPHYRPAWTAYMEKLVYDRWKLPYSITNRREVRISAQYVTMCHLIDKMQESGIEADEEQLRLFCTVARSAGNTVSASAFTHEEADSIMHSAPRRLRSMFHEIAIPRVEHGPHAIPIDPTPPRIPRPVTLHAYVRALGTFCDYEGLYSFAMWAANHAAEIDAATERQHSAADMWHRTLVALRSAMEGMLYEGRGTASAPRELMELVKAQIDSVEEWGGWPSDEDVDLYTNGRFLGHDRQS